MRQTSGARRPTTSPKHGTVLVIPHAGRRLAVRPVASSVAVQSPIGVACRGHWNRMCTGSISPLREPSPVAISGDPLADEGHPPLHQPARHSRALSHSYAAPYSRCVRNTPHGQQQERSSPTSTKRRPARASPDFQCLSVFGRASKSSACHLVEVRIVASALGLAIYAAAHALLEENLSPPRLASTRLPAGIPHVYQFVLRPSGASRRARHCRVALEVARRRLGRLALSRRLGRRSSRHRRPCRLRPAEQACRSAASSPCRPHPRGS